MALKPLRIEIDCVFECPECSTETWYTIRQLKHRKYLDCPCGKRVKIEQVTGVDVKYGKITEKRDSTGHATAEKVAETPDFPISDFVSTLAGLGYKKTEARKLIEQNRAHYKGDEGEFITFLLHKGTST